MDDEAAVKIGTWTPSLNPELCRVGGGYLHDGNAEKGSTSIVFTPDLPAAGEYEVVLVFVPNANRATRVPVTIQMTGGEAKTLLVNQRDSATKGFAPLGRFKLPKGKGTSVTISNRDTDGYVVADAVQFVPVK